MIFKKSGNALLFWLIMLFFSRNIKEQLLLTNQKLELNMLQIFKRKCIVNFRKYRKKIAKIVLSKNNKIKKKMKNWRTYCRISRSRMSQKYVVSVAQRQKLTFIIFCKSSNYDSRKISFLVRIHIFKVKQY